jgi:hypothetical protein
VKDSVLSPYPATFTLIYSNNPDSWSGKRKIERFSELDKILEEVGPERIKEVLAPVVLIQDGERFLIYKGNIEALHARQNSYFLRIIIIASQKDLEELFKCYPKYKNLWFGIDNLEELLKIMRIYASSPELEKQAKLLSPQDKETIYRFIKKYRENNKILGELVSKDKK